MGKKINHPEAIYFETEKIEISLVNGFAMWKSMVSICISEPKHFSFT
jgi:hypothetical protein